MITQHFQGAFVLLHNVGHGLTDTAQICSDIGWHFDDVIFVFSLPKIFISC